MPRLRAMLRDRRGGVAVIVALGATSVIGATALATDVGTWLRAYRDAQNAADAAALSSVRVLADTNRNFATSEAAARTIATANGFEHGVNATVTVTNITGAGTAPPRLRVRVEQVQPMILAGAIMGSARTIAAQAAALALSPPDGGACGLSLGGGISIGGSASYNMTGCALASNNTSDTALQFGSGGSTSGSAINVTAWTLVSSGGSRSFTTAQANGRVTLSGSQPAFYQQPIPNPYASITANLSIPSTNPGGAACTPISNSAAFTQATGSTTGWSYRVICNPGGPINQNMNFAAGTYIIQGDFRMNNRNLTGNGVTFIVQGNVDMSGNVNLVAPTTGPVPGVVFYSPAGNVSITANSSTNLTGGILAPVGTISMGGGGSSTNQPLSNDNCTVMIGWALDLRGNSGASVSNCNAYGTLVPQVRIVTLVE